MGLFAYVLWAAMAFDAFLLHKNHFKASDHACMKLYNLVNDRRDFFENVWNVSGSFVQFILR